VGNLDQQVTVDCQDAPLTDTQPVTPGCAPGSILGAGGDTKVVLMTRGGGQIVADLTNFVSGGDFTREIDNSSELKLTATVGGVLGQACCGAFEDAYQWALEIAVFRDGRDAWVGPVTELDFEYGKVSLTASDMSAWWSRRVLPTINSTSQDLADIFLAYHEAAMAPDPTPNFTIDPTPTGVYGTRLVNGNSYDYAMDHIQELAKTGVDWTAYGRTVIVGGQEVAVQPYVTLLDEHWTTPPTVAVHGNDQATVVIVKGNGVVGIARDDDYVAFYGELVRVFTEDSIDDVSSVQAAAESRLQFLKDPIYIEPPNNGQLRTNAPITLPELIPGMRIRVDSQATCRELIRDFRLQKVTVGFDGSVKVQLQPLGTLDATFSDTTLGST